MADPVPENVAVGLRRLIERVNDEILGWAPGEHPYKREIEPAIEWIEGLLKERASPKASGAE